MQAASPSSRTTVTVRNTLFRGDGLHDAEAMARAAGGSLGALVQLGTEQSGMRPGVTEVSVTGSLARAVPQAVATTLSPSEIEVTARVVGQWRFVPSSR